MGSEVKHLTLGQVLEIHVKVVEKFSKDKGLMAKGNLESALLRVEGYSEGGEEPIFWKGAILLERIITGHPFIDGNKRTGFESCKTFLEMNGYQLDPEDGAAIKFLVNIAKGKAGRHSIKNWLQVNSKRI